MEKISLKSIFNKYSEFGTPPNLPGVVGIEYFESTINIMMIEFGKQLLELASKNAKGKPFPMNKTGVIKYSDVDKQSITSTIKQVEYEENNN